MSNPLLRSLIENMIGNYLEESYEDDLMESIFEEVSEETWEAIEEAILNELSPDTLKSYIKGSKTDQHIYRKHYNANVAMGNYDTASIFANHHNKRFTGEKLARKKLFGKRD
jgi:hypothetical protein